jgi:hypothetical protein
MGGTVPPTPSNTSGTNIPSGWQSTVPAVSVGNVLWTSFGSYNANAFTYLSVPANTTVWSTPIATSVFQDIESDNWNGYNPPVYSNPASWGSAGYYISQSTGNCYFNNGIFRANINTSGAVFINGASTVYGGYTVGEYIYSPSTYASLLVDTTSTGNGIIAYAHTNYSVAGYFQQTGGTGSTAITAFAIDADANALVASNSASGGIAVNIGQGLLRYGATTIDKPPTSAGNTYFLRGDGVWSLISSITSGVSSFNTRTGAVTLTSADVTSAFALGATNGVLYWNGTSSVVASQAVVSNANTNSGSATASAFGMSFLGSTSTGIAGAYIGTSGSGSTVTFTIQVSSPSDIRLKEEITDSDLGLDFVKKLRPVSYKLKADPIHQKGYGFIADEVEKLIPLGSSLVYEDANWKVGEETGFKTIHYPSYIAVLTKAIQEMSEKIIALEAKIDTMTK